MKIFIGAHWPHHIHKWLLNLITYLRHNGIGVDYQTKFNGGVDMAERASKSDIVIIWNGEEECYLPTKLVCKENNIPCYIAEVGYFPQHKFFILDTVGINASSSLMNDDLSWITEKHMEKAKKRKVALMGKRKRIAGDYTFVPLQYYRDTNITHHSPFKDMFSFINHVEMKFRGDNVIFKRHPRDKTIYNSKFPVVTSGSSIDYVLRCKNVYGINSTVLFEAALFGVPVESIGDGLLRAHRGNYDKIVAALVDREIPVNTTNLDYWIRPIIEGQ
ncbi:MAG: hypothetical protein GF411_14165 [Candidatus Lokiarchaeota archaeon]|nr:hypothetical protein [Candidatus Lokiarchaeota archaeon]